MCTVTAFFRSDEELDAWRQAPQHGEQRGVRLSPSEALEAGRAIFQPSLSGVERRQRSHASAYDLVIIGAGSAGFAAAIAASEQGARVALIGSGVIGGTCTNIGCLPSETLIRAVETVHQARAASRFEGINGHAGVMDWRATVRQKNVLVTAQRQAKCQARSLERLERRHVALRQHRDAIDRLHPIGRLQASD